MNADFYTISCPKDVINKTGELGAATQKTIHAYEAVDDLTANIIVSPSVANCNYVKLTITGKDRYYFVVSRETMTGDRCMLTLEEDVLMTWKDVVMTTPAIIRRSNIGSSKDFTSDIPLLSFSRISEESDAAFEYGDNSDLCFVIVSASQSATAAEDGGGVIQDFAGHSGGGGGVHW